MKTPPAISLFLTLLLPLAAGAAVPQVAEPGARFIALPGDKAAGALLGPFVIKAEPATGELLVQAPAGNDPAAWAASMLKAGRFAYITPDVLCEVQDEPADPQFPSQWHLRTMRLPQAWQISTGSPAVTIAVVDTGIDLSHPDLLGQRVLGASSVNAMTWQTSLSDPVVADISGHGTEVAGVVAAGTANGIGVASVGRNIRVLPIKASASSTGGAFLSDILRGVRAAADAGATAVSVSYSGVTSPAVQTTGAYAAAAGSMLFWAAGNNGAILGPESDWPDVIIVGATDQADQLAAFSARGVAIDLVAPGVSILTTALASGYSSADGTSFATPVAAAMAGLIKSASPTLSGAQIEGLLKNSARDLGDAGKDALYGYGRVDALSALASAAGTASPIALPDRILCLTGQNHAADVLFNDADPLGRPLAVHLDGTMNPALGTATVVADAATGLDVVSLSILPTAAPGTFTLPYTITTSSQSASSILTVTIDSASEYAEPLRPLKQASGLQASYYQLAEPPTGLPDLGVLAPTAGGLVPNLNIRATDLPPDGLADGTNFAALYSGLFVAPVDGLYTLTLEADDGAQMTLGSGAAAVTSITTILTPGTVAAKLRAGVHPLVVEHFQADGTWTIALSAASVDAGQPLADIAGATSFSRAVPIADLVDGGGNPVPDGIIDGSDFIAFINAFVDGDALADITGAGPDFIADGIVDGNDFITFINAFAGGY